MLSAEPDPVPASLPHTRPVTAPVPVLPASGAESSASSPLRDAMPGTAPAPAAQTSPEPGEAGTRPSPDTVTEIRDRAVSAGASVLVREEDAEVAASANSAMTPGTHAVTSPPPQEHPGAPPVVAPATLAGPREVSVRVVDQPTGTAQLLEPALPAPSCGDFGAGVTSSRSTARSMRATVVRGDVTSAADTGSALTAGTSTVAASPTDAPLAPNLPLTSVPSPPAIPPLSAPQSAGTSAGLSSGGAGHGGKPLDRDLGVIAAELPLQVPDACSYSTSGADGSAFTRPDEPGVRPG